MHSFNCLWSAALAAGFTLLASGSMPAQPHAGRFPSGYTGPSSCLRCHPGKVDEVIGSVHYTWRTPNPKLAFPGGGAHGMIDRFCALVGSSAMLNYYADLSGHKGSSACGKCHVGDSVPFPDPATGQPSQAQKDGIDCLICHASDGNYDMNGDGVYDATDETAANRALMTNSVTGRRYWFQDRSLQAAESVGARVSNGACLRCHEHGMSAPDYKRGTPFDPQHDVHAAARLLCTDCHLVNQHQMARGSRVADMHGWERQDVEVDCTTCHTATPHPTASPYNDHTSFIACETCHIPWTSGASRRVWASVYGVSQGPEASVPSFQPDTGVWEPYSAYTPVFAERPVYRWFNGGVSMLAEPVNDPNAWDFQVASKTTPNARIYPFRPIVNGMVMDRRGIHAETNFAAQFTMAAALDSMANPLKAMGFLRPSGLTEPERLVLGQFPNLLVFDEEHYIRTGNTTEAVDIALARMGLMMSGQDPLTPAISNLIAMGSTMWSGSVAGMDLPNNPNDPLFNPNAGPTNVTGSFISLSHAIKPGSQALHCADCHSSASVLNFKALGYASARADRLMGLFTTMQFISSSPTSGGLLLRWSSQAGRTYQLLSAPDLHAANWTPVGSPVVTTNPWCQYQVPLTSAKQAFFRVQLLP